MCSFDSKGKSLFSARENQKDKIESAPAGESDLSKNPITSHLAQNSEKIGKILGISKEDMEKDSMRIWNIMNP